MHPLVDIDVPHDVGAAVLHLFHDRAQLFKRVFVDRRMAFSGKTMSPETNTLAGSLPFAALARSPADIVNPVCDDLYDRMGPRLPVWIIDLIRCAEIRGVAGRGYTSVRTAARLFWPRRQKIW